MGYTLRSHQERQAELLGELERITHILQTLDVEKVIVFGSLVRGEISRTSDIDLLVVQETEKGFLDRIGDVYAAVLPRKALDVIVYTPQELKRLAESSSFVQRILSEGRVLYEKDRG